MGFLYGFCRPKRDTFVSPMKLYGKKKPTKLKPS